MGFFGVHRPLASGAPAHSSRYFVMNRRWAARASAPKSTMRMLKKPTRSSNRRGIIGCSGSRTRLQWASTLVAARGCPPAGGAGVGVGAPPATPVWVASISTLSGKAIARST